MKSKILNFIKQVFIPEKQSSTEAYSNELKVVKSKKRSGDVVIKLSIGDNVIYDSRRLSKLGDLRTQWEESYGLDGIGIDSKNFSFEAYYWIKLQGEYMLYEILKLLPEEQMWNFLPTIVILLSISGARLPSMDKFNIDDDFFNIDYDVFSQMTFYDFLINKSSYCLKTATKLNKPGLFINKSRYQGFTKKYDSKDHSKLFWTLIKDHPLFCPELSNGDEPVRSLARLDEIIMAINAFLKKCIKKMEKPTTLKFSHSPERINNMENFLQNNLGQLMEDGVIYIQKNPILEEPFEFNGDINLDDDPDIFEAAISELSKHTKHFTIYVWVQDRKFYEKIKESSQMSEETYLFRKPEIVNWMKKVYWKYWTPESPHYLG